MKIYYKRLKDVSRPLVLEKGDWVDLYVPMQEDIEIPANTTYRIPLGIAMRLPPGMEAILAFRSSTSTKYDISPANGFGVIDQSYCGENDEWKFPVRSFSEVKIPVNSRLFQFRIQLSQKATFWQKLRWLFSNKVELVETSILNNENRGGFGSTD